MGPARFLQNAYIGSSDSYGSETQPIYWNDGVPTAITSYGGNAATATVLSTSGTTGQFWRGDNTWSNILTSSLLVSDLTIGGTAGTNAGKTITSNSTLYLTSAGNASIILQANNGNQNCTVRMDTSGDFRPEINQGVQLGSGTYRWKALFVGTANTYGSATQPIYWNDGVPAATTYSLSATINAGAANRAAYYSGTNAISQASSIYMNTTKIGINSTTEPTQNLFVNGTARFAIGSSDYSSNKNFIIGSSGRRYLSIGAAGLQGYDASDAASILYFQYEGGNIQLGQSATKKANTTAYGDIIPGATSTYNIGSNSAHWLEGLFDKVKVSSSTGFEGSSTNYNGTSIDAAGTTYSCRATAHDTYGGFRLYGNAARYASFYISTLGTAGNGTSAGTLGYANLNLGNNTAQAASGGADNAAGRIYLYGSNAYAAVIYADTSNFTANRGFHLPNYNDTMYATHVGSTAAVGSGTQPVYVAANGRLTATTYALNATISAGTANQVAYYSGTNTIASKAPAWEAWVAGTSAGPQAKIQIGNASYTSAAIPSAGAGASGIVTTGDQQFDGNKTFKGNILPQANGTYTVGSSSLHWLKGYFNALAISENTGFTSESTNYNGTYITIAGTIYSNRTAKDGGFRILGNDKSYGGLYIGEMGTASDGTNQGTLGYGQLVLGNNTAQGAATSTDGADNARGRIYLYGANKYAAIIYARTDGYTASRQFFIPNYDGQMNAAHTAGTGAVGSLTQPVYVEANGRIASTTYSLNAAINAGTTPRMAYYSGDNAISNTPNISYINAVNSTATTPSPQNGLRIWGSTIGNTAATLISNTAGVFSYGDGGPQIQFSTGASTAQDGALIYTDHDTAATGASWHFVSNQSDWNVTSKRFHARAGISIGTDKPVTTKALSVTGDSLFTGHCDVTGQVWAKGGNFYCGARAGTTNAALWFGYTPTDESATWYRIVQNHNNGNVSINACTGGLFLGWQNTVRINIGSHSYGSDLPADNLTTGRIFFKI